MQDAGCAPYAFRAEKPALRKMRASNTTLSGLSSCTTIWFSLQARAGRGEAGKVRQGGREGGEGRVGRVGAQQLPVHAQPSTHTKAGSQQAAASASTALPTPAPAPAPRCPPAGQHAVGQPVQHAVLEGDGSPGNKHDDNQF
jgi:hypothetical protein